MKRYAAIRKLAIMVLLSILGSYCIGAAQQEYNAKQYVHEILDTTSSFVKSLGSYCCKLWAELGVQWNKIFSYSEQNVTIQYRAPEKKRLHQQDDSYYLDLAKCDGDAKEDCVFNASFFGGTYFATGPNNFDPTLSLDYSNDPIVIE